MKQRDFHHLCVLLLFWSLFVCFYLFIGRARPILLFEADADIDIGK